MKKLLLLSCFIIAAFAQAQVGIGTVNPQAQLDIRSTNQSTPANNDGILIPKIDEYPATNPTAAQDGMMVFATGAGSVSKGFYFWDIATTSWVGFSGSGGGKDWYEEGTTTAPDDINDDIYTFGNVAIGKNTADYKLDIFEDAADIGAYINLAGSSASPTNALTTEITNSGDGEQRGINTLLSASGNGTHWGSFVTINGNGNGNHYGMFNQLTGSGTGIHFGIRNELLGSGSAIQEGTRNFITNTGDGDHYGVYTSLSGTGQGLQFGVNNIIDNTGNADHFGTQNTLSGTGTGAQIGVRNTHLAGSGNLTGTVTEFGGTLGDGNQICAYNSYFAGGNGILAGDYTDIRNSVTGNGSQYGSFTSNSSPGSGIHFGSENILAGTGTGQQYGVYNTISNSSDASHSGIWNVLSSPGSGSHVGVQNILNAGSGYLTGVATEFGGTLGNGNQICAYNSYFSGGNGILAGDYTDIRDSVTGTGSQYGSFTTNSSPGSGIHYGSENVLSGTGIGEQFGVYNTISNSGNAGHTGVRNVLSSSGTGYQIGVQSNFNAGSGNLTGYSTEFNGPLGNGNQICAYNSYFTGGNGILAGAYTDIRNTVAGTGNQYGTFTSIDSPGSGEHYGNYNSLTNSGSGTKYGTYNIIPSTTGGTHYGVYSDVQKAGSYAGYFLGNFAVDINTLYVDATTNSIGVGTLLPLRNFHLRHARYTGPGGYGGLDIEQSFNNNKWTLYTSQSTSVLALYYNEVLRGSFNIVTGAYTAVSDIRLKKDITEIGPVMDRIMKLRPTEYHFKEQANTSEKSPGFIAQEVIKIFPAVVKINPDDTNGKGLKDLHTISYSEIIPYMVKGIQEQQTQIDQLKQQLEDQKAELLELRNLILAKQ